MSNDTTHCPRATQWQQHLNAWKLSGLSRAKFCREHNLNYSVFNYWHAKANKSEPPASKKLVPVVASNLKDSVNGSGLEIGLPNGVCIRGIDHASVHLVGQLLAQL